MRKLIIVAFLGLFGLSVNAQNSKTATTDASAGSTPKSSNTIILDQQFGTTDKPIPIDARFYLEIDNISVDADAQISVYRVKKVQGSYVLADCDKQLNCPTSFIFDKSDVTIKKDKLILHFPPIKPEEAFDVQITRKFSPANVKRILAINSKLEALATGTTFTSKQVDALNDDVAKQLKVLSDSVNNTSVYGIIDKDGKKMASPTIFAYNQATFTDAFFTPEATHYKLLFPEDYPGEPDKYSGWKYLDPGDLQLINTNCQHYDLMYDHLYPLQRLLDDKQTDNVVKGLVPFSYGYPIKAADHYEIDQRLKNLAASRLYIDSLLKFTQALTERNVLNAGDVNKKVLAMRDAILTNEKLMSTEYEAIKKGLTKNNCENLWLSGSNNKSTDLVTVSKRHVTLDIGVTDIFAYNNLGQVKAIPKLFFGINIFFRGLDKNIDPNDRTTVSKDGCSHSLETQSLFLTKFSLTAGVTLGSMTTTDFSNVYSSFSFTLGPSYQFFHIARISAGFAALDRVNNNPLYSNKHVVLGEYISVSLDQDLFSAAKSVIDAITK